MYNKIVNPESGRMVSVNSKLGKVILKNYLNQLGGASAESKIKSYIIPDRIFTTINLRLFFKVTTKGIKLYIPIPWSMDELKQTKHLQIEKKYGVLLITSRNINSFKNTPNTLYNILDNSPHMVGMEIDKDWSKKYLNIINIIELLLKNGKPGDIYDPSRSLSKIESIPKLEDILENIAQRDKYRLLIMCEPIRRDQRPPALVYTDVDRHGNYISWLKSRPDSPLMFEQKNI